MKWFWYWGTASLLGATFFRVTLDLTPTEKMFWWLGVDAIIMLMLGFYAVMCAIRVGQK